MSGKGLLSKSIANNISEAIIDKLGGTGYAPTEWSKNINLLGIASTDIEEALASITEDASSSDKGLLSLSIASDMGAILNKKYNTSRGFKPSEVSSAVSALIPLPEKTTPSASIATFSDGADEVPIKSWEVEIAPTLTGKSAIECTQTGKNLLNVPAREEMTRNNIVSSIASDGTITASGQSSGNGDIPITFGTSVSLKSGQVYTFSLNGTDTRTGSVYVYFAGGSYISINNANHSGTYTPSADQTITGVTLRMFNGQSITLSAKIMLEVGSTASSYSPYVAPTVSTVNLGRTIYGGTADVVTGDGTDENGNDFTFTPITPTPETALGVNNFWADEGDSEVTYRADINLYEAPSMLLEANNTETEGNEEQEVNE